MKKTLAALSLCLAVCVRLSAQTVPTLAADLSTGPTGLSPYAITPCNGNLYMLVNSGVPGNDAYKFNTTVGASKLATVGATPFTNLTSANSKIYYNNFSYTTNNLYYTDGTSVPVAVDVNYAIMPCNTVTDGSGNVYFAGYSIVLSGPPLGIFAANPSNTIDSIFDVSHIKINGTDVTNITSMVYVNKKLYFVVDNGVGSSHDHTELAMYDLTTKTGSVVSSFTSAGEKADIENLVAGDDGHVYFTATTSAEGRELYTHTGTGSVTKLTALNTTSDGIEPLINSSDVPYHNLVKMGGYIYFAGCDGIHGFDLMRLKLSDNSTTLVKDINASTNSSQINNMYVYGGQLYFNADDGTHGPELWVTDGTTTTMVADTYPGASGSDPSGFATYNGKLYFDADNGTTGFELYCMVSTGALAVTAVNKVGDLKIYPNPASDAVNISLDLKQAETLTTTITDAAGKVVFAAVPGNFNAGNTVISASLSGYAPGTYHFSIRAGNGEVIASGAIAH